ncbi:carboxypeptidase B [Rhagoletis pomonella]|uniref:carboxypeptidase B n=1 Tax=Rhagoletis pomonella TaxID=28610 RepID=UPI001783D7D1|nr:carboxypeptidase B [Rhagoletis pomonella]
MPHKLKKHATKKRAKKTVSLSKFRKLVVPRPDVLHGYLRHDEINLYLEYLQNRYSFVTVHTLGQSYERRALKAIEIDWNSEKNMDRIERHRTRRTYMDKTGTAPPPPPPSTNRVQSTFHSRNMIFIEGGTHAREWITIAVALNCIYQLTEKHIRNYELLRKLRFIIVPVTNPDGYEYTFTKNRRWRKNRRPISHTRHIGTDCNRNYDFHWEDGPSKVTRNTYKGVKPFSEPETRAIRNILQKNKQHLLFFLSLHSYAECIMYPWAYCKELPETWQKLEKLALTGRNAIKAYNGRHYRVGSIAILSKRRISGSIVDYAFGVIQVPLALVMELPSHTLGFQPPAESISPIGHESWLGIREMCKVAYDLVPPCLYPAETLLSNTATTKDQTAQLQRANMKITKQHPTSTIDKQPFYDAALPLINNDVLKNTQVPVKC